MPTVQQVIDMVQLPGPISDATKYHWLGRLDKVKYKYPKDKDTKLAMENEAIYEKYLIAMSDFFSGDMEAYQESANAFMKEFERKDS